MDNSDFDPASGVFSCEKEGVYSFALTSLMKSESNQQVTLKMMHQGRNGKVSSVEVEDIAESCYIRCPYTLTG